LSEEEIHQSHDNDYNSDASTNHHSSYVSDNDTATVQSEVDDVIPTHNNSLKACSTYNNQQNEEKSHEDDNPIKLLVSSQRITISTPIQYDRGGDERNASSNDTNHHDSITHANSSLQHVDSDITDTHVCVSVNDVTDPLNPSFASSSNRNQSSKDSSREYATDNDIKTSTNTNSSYQCNLQPNKKKRKYVKLSRDDDDEEAIDHGSSTVSISIYTLLFSSYFSYYHYYFCLACSLCCF
jgi:hypothetical protein